MSLHGPTMPGRLMSCSGAMYSTVPTVVPIAVISSSASAMRMRAMPKSTTLTKSRRAGSRITRMLSGFRSRWTMSRRCAADMASHTCSMMRPTRPMGMRRCACSSFASDGPSTNSMTR